jgi:hypothetical protein
MLKIALEPGPSAFLVEGAEEYTDVWSCAKAEDWEARQVSGRSVLVCPDCAIPGND